jgi:glycosyltransferase involved in cell wall biosynthesis
MTLSIIIPAYNSGAKIGKLINKIKSVDFGNNKIQTIVVNDASSDNTLEVLKKIKGIIVLNHKKNTGKGGAVATGLKKSTGEILFIQDDDLEYDPQDIPKIIKPILDKKSKVVYGSRRLNKKNSYSSPLYFWGGVMIDTIISMILRYPLTDAITGSKAFTREVYEEVKPIESKGFDVEAEITAKILKNKFSILEVPITYNPRSHSEGKNIRWHDGIPMLKTLIRYSFFA